MSYACADPRRLPFVPLAAEFTYTETLSSQLQLCEMQLSQPSIVE